MHPLETLVLSPVAESVALVSGRGLSVSVSLMESPYRLGQKGGDGSKAVDGVSPCAGKLMGEPACRVAPRHCSSPAAHSPQATEAIKNSTSLMVKGQFNSVTLHLVGEEERGWKGTWRYSLLLSTLGVQPLSSLLSRLC